VFSKLIFLFLFSSTLLLSQESPVLYDSLSKPLFKVNEVFSDSYLLKKFHPSISKYRDECSSLILKGEELNQKKTAMKEQKEYLLALRQLQKEYKTIIRTINLELIKTIDEDNNAEFIKIIEHTKGVSFLNKGVYEKSVKYYLNKPTKLHSGVLEAMIKEDKKYINLYNQKSILKSAMRKPKIVYKRYGHLIDMGPYIKDTRTGLLWQKDGMSGGKKNFFEAKEYARNLKLGGLNGWRVPTRVELATIFPADKLPFKRSKYVSVKCCDGDYNWNSYWTSERDYRLDDYAYVYHWYADGSPNNCYASKNYVMVRCVRGTFRKRD